MKITVDVDCTPEEARRFMGLPDLTVVHDAYLRQILDAMQNGISRDTLDGMLKSWGPMSDVSLAIWKQAIDGMANASMR